MISIPPPLLSDTRTHSRLTLSVQALVIPNPTDEALGIDELTELRLALAAANETRTIPSTVRSNRELAKYAKAMIGDMVVPEEVMRPSRPWPHRVGRVCVSYCSPSLGGFRF